MNKLITALFTLIMAISVNGQQDEDFKTIFGEKQIGGYGAFSLGYSPINDVSAIMFNARGGVVLGHTLSLGIGGSGFTTEYFYDPVLIKETSMYGGYGGLFSELIIAGNMPVHLSVPVLVGIGGVAIATWENNGIDEYYRENYVEDMSTFFVFEPGIELEVNMFRFFRLAAFFNYRYTTDIELNTIGIGGVEVPLTEARVLNSYTAGIIFKFGKF